MQFFFSAPSGNLFDPLSVKSGTIKLWLDPTDADTVTKDGSDGIEQVLDKSGRDLHLTYNASFSAAKTTHDADSAIQFDGTNTWNICGGDGGQGDSNEFNFLHNGTGGTVVMVVKLDESNAGGLATLFSTAQFVSTGQTGVTAWYRDDGIFNSQLSLNIVSPSGQVAQPNFGDYGIELGRYIILTIKKGKELSGSDNDIQARINNAFHGGADKNAAAFPTGDSNWGLLLGSTGTGTVGEVRFKEVLVYEDYLDDADLLKLHVYLNKKHSVYDREVPVHVLIGQSNAQGYAAINNASDFAPYDSVPRVLMSDAKNDADWELLRANFNNGGLGSSQFGAEMSFGIDHSAATTSEIAVIKYAVGSTSLAVDWAEDGATYQAAITAINSKIAELSSQFRRTPVIKSIPFLQGESDAQGAAFANAYEDNQTDLNARLRADINGASSDTLIILPEIYTDDPVTWPAVGTVNAAKAAVAAADDNVVLIENTGFGTIASDDIHWNAATQELVGSEWSRQVRLSTATTLSLSDPIKYDTFIENVATTITGSAPSDLSVEIYDGATKLGDATLSGGTFSFDHTFTATDFDVQIKAVGELTGDSETVPAVVSQASTAQTDISAWGRNSYSNYTVTSGHPDPDGGNNAYKIEVTNAFTGELKLSSAAFTGTPDETDNSLAVWLGRPASSNIGVSRIWLRGGGSNEVHSAYMMLDGEPYVDLQDTYAYLRQTATASNDVQFSEWVIQQVTDDGDSEAAYDRLVLYAHTGDYHGVDGQVYGQDFAVGDVLYVYDPRNISGSIPFTIEDQVGVRYTGVTGGVDYYEFRHEYISGLNDFLGNKSVNFGNMMVNKPDGWTAEGDYPVLWLLGALAFEGGSAEPTLPFDYAETLDIANTYNCLVVSLDITQSGTDYYATKNDNSQRHDDLIRDVLKPFVQKHLGGSADTDEHIVASYSKGAIGALSFMFRANSPFGYAAIDDMPYDMSYGDNQSDQAYGSSAQFDLYNPKTIIGSAPAALETEKRILLVGGYTFPTGMDNAAAALTSNSILHDYLDLTHTEHSFKAVLDNIGSVMTLAGISGSS